MTSYMIQAFQCDVCGKEESFKVENNWGVPKDSALHEEYLRRSNWETVSVEVYNKLTPYGGDDTRYHPEITRYEQTRCPDCVRQLIDDQPFRANAEEELY